MLKKIKNFFNLNSPYICLPLASFASLFFLLEKNWTHLTKYYFCLTLAIMLGSSLLFYGLFKLIYFNYFKSGFLKKKKNLDIYHLIIGLCTAYFIWFWLQNTILAIFLGNKILLLLIAILFLAIILIISYYRFFKLLNVFFLCFLSLSIINLTLSYWRSDSHIEPYPLKIKLNSTPNIYIITLESYTGFEILSKTYRVDTSKFEAFLKDNNFFVYENTYAPAPLTLMSMGALFHMKYLTKNMRPVVSNIKANMSPLYSTRDLISGDENNTVFRILKENGYFTANIYKETVYFYGTNQGANVDYINFQDKVQATYVIGHINKQLKELFFQVGLLLKLNSHPEDYRLKKYFNDFKLLLNKVPAKQPLAVSIKTGVIHTNTLTYDWHSDKGSFISYYKYLIDENNIENQTLVEYIIKKDPKALIVLIGDHGPWLYREAWIGAGANPAAIHKLLASKNLTEEIIANDLFNVLLAVRMPDGYKDISQGLAMNHVNLFRHIFSDLNQDPSLLNDRQPSESYIFDFKKPLVAVREGQPLSLWEEIEN